MVHQVDPNQPILPPNPLRSWTDCICEQLVKIARKVWTVVKEVLSLFAFAAFYPLGWITSGKWTANTKVTPEHPPVIFVHGFLHNLSGSCFLFERLKRKGWTHLYALNLGNPITHSIHDYTQKLAAFVEEVRKESGAEKVILIGHSMGGVVSANYALDPANQDAVAKVVTLGSPHQGTIAAHLGKVFSPCARDMLPNSSQVKNLKKMDEENKKVPVLCVGAAIDALILPSSSAFLNGPLVTSERVTEEGHLSLMYSDKVFRLLNDFISTKEV